MSEKEFNSLSQAARYCHVKRQAIYLAIKKKKLNATKINGRWLIILRDLEEYRKNKYNRDLRKVNGEMVYNLEKGHYSVTQVAKVISDQMGIKYSRQRIYFLIRSGQLKAFRKGTAWIVEKEDAAFLLKTEMEKLELRRERA